MSKVYVSHFFSSIYFSTHLLVFLMSKVYISHLLLTNLASNCCMKRVYMTFPSWSRGTRSKKDSNWLLVNSMLNLDSMAARNSSWLITSVPRWSIFLTGRTICGTGTGSGKILSLGIQNKFRQEKIESWAVSKCLNK